MSVKRITLYTVLGIVGLAVVAVAGAFVYIQNTDFAPFVVSKVKDETGFEIQAAGPLTVKLLPHPVVTASKLTVNAPRGGTPLLTVDAADIQLAWGRGLIFWKGITLSRFHLENPTVYLHKPASGPANWQTAEAYAEQVEEQQEGEADGIDFERNDKLPFSSFGTIDVANLNLTYIDETSGRRVEARNVNLQADATDLNDARMQLEGTVNGQPLQGRAALSFADLNRVPLTANLLAADIKMALDGEIRDQKAYAGAVNVQTPDLKASLDKLLGSAPPQAPASPFSLTGDVATGGEELALRNFNASLGNLLKATGDVEATLGDSPSARGSFSASGSNLRQLVALATGQSNAQLPAAPFKLSTRLSGQDEIVLRNLNFELNGLASANGEMSIVPAAKAGDLPEVDGKLNVRGGNLRALARAFGNQGNLPTQPFNATASIEGKGTYTLDDFSAQLGTLANVTGELEVTPKPVMKVAGEMNLSGNDLATTAKAFGVTADLPRSAYNAGFKLGGDKRIEVSDLTVSLPQLLEAEGFMSLAAAAPHDIQGKLTVNRLNLNALGYCRQVSTGGGTAETASKAAPSASQTPWSDEPLPMDSLRNITFDVDVAVNNMNCASFPASSVAFKAVNTREAFTMNNMHITLPQSSSADVALTMNHADTASMNMTLKTTDVPVQELMRTLKDKGLVLPLTGTATLTSRGGTTRQLAQNLNGSIDFSADSGQVPYSRLLGNISNINSLIQGKLPTQRDESIRSMVAKYTVTNGVMTTDELNITTDGMVLTGTGTINLPAWSINYQVEPSIDHGEISIPVNVKGSLGSPNIGPDSDFMSKLTGRLTSEGLQGLLGMEKDETKGIGGAVGDLLGGKGLKGEGVQNLIRGMTGGNQASPTEAADEASPTEGEASSSSPTTQQDPVQNLIQGVFGQ